MLLRSLIPFLLILSPTSSKIVNRTLDTLESFVYIDRFVFYPTPPSESPQSPSSSQNDMDLYDYGLIRFDIEYVV